MAPEVAIYLWQTHVITALILGFYILLKVKCKLELKIAWMLMVLFVPLIGSLAYLSFGRKYLKT